MKTATTLAPVSLLASAAYAQVVQWDIARREIGKPRLTRRADGTFEEVVTNEKNRGGYFASCQAGTPGQNLTLQLDTGSSDIWVVSSSASVCDAGSTAGSQGCTLGSFNTGDSTSFEVVGKNDFSISYVDGSSSKGDYITETFEIGGATLNNLTMGLGLDTDIPYGLVGVGYALNEASVAQSGSTSDVYDNLPVLMHKEGLIATNAYSLWLNDLDASTGSILFGGIDTDKYRGDLTRINIYPTQSNIYTSFMVALTSLQASSSSGTDELSSSELPVAVVLDSGTTFSYLPTDLAEQVWHEVGAGYNSDVGLALLPCEMENSEGHFSFGFAGPDGPRINVTMDELVLPLTIGEPIQFQSGPYDGQDACQFGIQNFSSSSTYLLGDTFLRSAYVVYDLVNNEIAIAPTDFNATTSNIVAFPSEGAEVPSSTPAPSQDAVAANGQLASPTYGASDGFQTESGAAFMPYALDWSKVAVMGTSLAFMMVGSGFFLLI